MRLIDADALKNDLTRFYDNVVTAKQLIDEQPTVEAEPVVHGRWMTCEDGWGDLHYQCSECGCEWFLEDGSPADNDMNYCPNCGAKMDGGEDDEAD